VAKKLCETSLRLLGKKATRHKGNKATSGFPRCLVASLPFLYASLPRCLVAFLRKIIRLRDAF
jgi:hypothetical protein